LKVFLSTADASGDLHAAAFVEALRARTGELDVYGLGGPTLEAAGLRPRLRQSELAVAGLFEILSSLPRLLRCYTQLRSSLRSEKPDLAVFVDSPDLNLPLASVAKRSRIPVLYYIVPQIWAWRPGRIRKLARRVDHAAAIFPFEEPLLREAGIPVTYVGHPLVERLGPFREAFQRDEFLRSIGLDPVHPVLALLPGSRRNEFDSNLPILIDTAALARKAMPELQVVLALAPTLHGVPLETPEWVQVVDGQPHEVMSAAECVLSAPGTATIEAAILGTPLVVVHRVNPLSFAAARRFVRVPSSCMVNLVADAGVVPERLQEEARPAVIAGLALRLLRNPGARDEMRSQLATTVARLGGPGASERTAEIAVKLAGGR
jgi:lipid-A-disaccharide synthase